jgi:kynurenine formamidase
MSSGALWSDLSQPVEPGMPKLSFLPEPQFTAISELSDTRPKVSAVDVCMHLGTHVDAPSHFIRGGKNIEDFPLERFLVQAVVWPVSVDPLAAITPAQLEGLSLQPGDAVLLSTGWGEIYKDPQYHDHPYLADEAAAWFVEQGASMVGVDFFTPDKPPRLRDETFSYPVHKTLLGNEVLIIENLTGLAALAGRRVELYAAPLSTRAELEAAPARVFARALA